LYTLYVGIIDQIIRDPFTLEGMLGMCGGQRFLFVLKEYAKGQNGVSWR
jgi:hypothetical protein